MCRQTVRQSVASRYCIERLNGSRSLSPFWCRSFPNISGSCGVKKIRGLLSETLSLDLEKFRHGKATIASAFYSRPTTVPWLLHPESSFVYHTLGVLQSSVYDIAAIHAVQCSHTFICTTNLFFFGVVAL